jgi:hypothetical protein
MAHELAHNLVSVHGAEHSYWTEQLVISRMPGFWEKYYKSDRSLISTPMTPAISSTQFQNMSSGSYLDSGLHSIPSVEPLLPTVPAREPVPPNNPNLKILLGKLFWLSVSDDRNGLSKSKGH